MIDSYASDFNEIPAALAGNPGLRSAIISQVATQPVAGKVTEGGDRLAKFRAIPSGS
jgi:hypothetical protein